MEGAGGCGRNRGKEGGREGGREGESMRVNKGIQGIQDESCS